MSTWTRMDSESDDDDFAASMAAEETPAYRTYAYGAARRRRVRRYAAGGALCAALALVLVVLYATSGSGTTATAPTDGTGTHTMTNGSLPAAARAALVRVDPAQLRLPAHVRPTAYALELQPDARSGELWGRARIAVALGAPSDALLLHAAGGLNVSDVRLAADNDAGWPAASVAYYGGDAQYVALAFPALAGAVRRGVTRFTLSLAFRTRLGRDMNGFYVSTYADARGATRYVAATQFEATGARYAFPCFDEPAFKATWTIALLVDRALYPTVLSNMPEARAAPAASLSPLASNANARLTRVEFERSELMSSYLVAMLVADYAAVRAPVVWPPPDAEHPAPPQAPRVDIHVYAPNETIAQAQFAANVARQALDVFERFFDIPYPLPKMDLVAIPDFSAGAMENWGLITFRTVDLLYSNQHSTEREKERVATTVVHEIAHQWFGNLVTMQWWDELWLNEGFATFMQYYATNEIFADVTNELKERGWLMWESFSAEQRAAMRVDALESTHPIRQTVERPSDVELLFDTISYSKGGSLLRMLFKSDIMANGNFQAGLHKYLSKYQMKNARSVELFDELATASGEEDLRDMLEPWIAQPGYPVITLEQVSADDEYVAVQQRYIEQPSGDADEAAENARMTWWVPLNIANDDNQVPITLMPGQSRSKPFTVSNKYFVANADRWGLYRVAYPPRLMTQLLGHIERNGIGAGAERFDQELKGEDRPVTPLDYAGTLDDLRSFSVAGFNNVTAADVLRFATHVQKTRSELCWSTVMSAVGSFTALLDAGGDTDNKAKLERYARQLLAPLVSEAIDGNDNGDDVDHSRAVLFERVVPYAVELDESKAKQMAAECWTKFKRGESCVPANSVLKADGSLVPPHMQSAVFTYATLNDAEVAYEPLFSLFQSSIYPGERRRLLSALVQVNAPSVRTRLLNEALPGGKVRPQDARSVIVGVARASKEGRAAAWQFVRDNFGRLSGSGSIFGGVSRNVAGIGSTFATQADLTEFQAFVDAHKSEGLDGRDVQLAIDNIKHNIAWLARNRASITEFFAS